MYKNRIYQEQCIRNNINLFRSALSYRYSADKQPSKVRLLEIFLKKVYGKLTGKYIVVNTRAE